MLLAEAGTGTGKTLAYLVPGDSSRQRVLVSTGTKNLQEQIFFKDIPALREALGVPFTATCMKGRANYLCLHRLDQLNERPSPDSGVSTMCSSRSFASGRLAPKPAIARSSRICRRICRSGTKCRRQPKPVSARSVRATTTASSRGCASAPRLRTSSSSTIICCAPTPPCARTPTAKSFPRATSRRCRRSASTRGRRDAVLRVFGQQLPGRGSSRATSSGFGVRRDRRFQDRTRVDRQGRRALRDHARTFFADLALAHRAGATSGLRRQEERVRATETTLGQTAGSRRPTSGRARS